MDIFILNPVEFWSQIGRLSRQTLRYLQVQANMTTSRTSNTSKTSKNVDETDSLFFFDEEEQDLLDADMDVDDVDTPVYNDDGLPNEEEDAQLVEEQIQKDSNQVLNICNSSLDNSRFFLTMNDCKNFKNFVAAVENLIRECKWYVLKNDDFSGIHTYSANADRNCFMMAYFSCNVVKVLKEGDDMYKKGSDEFTIYMDVLKKLLKPIDADSCIGFYSAMHSDEIEIYGINPQTLNFSYDCNMKLLDMEMEEFKVRSEVVFDFCLSVDTKKLTDIMQGAIDNSADNFTIFIEGAETMTGEDGKKQRWNRTTLQIIGSHSTQRFKFYSLTDVSEVEVVDANSNKKYQIQMELNTETNCSNWPANAKELYRDTFSVHLFRNFLRSMLQPKVPLYIKKNNPMVIYTPFGGSGNKIYYFISPIRDPDSISDDM